METHSKLATYPLILKTTSTFEGLGWTLCNEIQNLTKQKAFKKLGESKVLFEKMLAVAIELNT
jgi:hypothetical protein